MYVSIQPTEALQASVIKDLILEYEQSRFVCITTNSAKGDPLWGQLFRYVATTEDNSTGPRCIIIQEKHLAIEEIYTALTAIKASGVRVIIVHCSAEESKEIIYVAQKLSLKRLSEDFVWIFSDKAKDISASEFPVGSIGISKVRELATETEERESEDADSRLLNHLLRDSVWVFAKALAKTLENKSVLWLRCLEGEVFASFKVHLYRYVLSCTV